LSQDALHALATQSTLRITGDMFVHRTVQTSRLYSIDLGLDAQPVTKNDLIWIESIGFVQRLFSGLT
jgi:hypothetical protein